MKNSIVSIINTKITSMSEEIKLKIKSIYIFGSVVNEENISDSSDIDIWYVISNLDIEERFSLTLTIYEINDQISNLLLEYGLINSKGHKPCVSTIDEFLKYIEIYPARVAYPIAKGYWYLAYGKSFNDFALNYLPNKKNIVNDFFVLMKEAEVRLFSINSYDFYKYAFRTIRKWLWYISDYYIPNRWNLLGCCN